MSDLAEFFGVTLSGSVYKAKIGGDGKIPALVKIAERPDAKRGIPIGNQIDNGSMIAIAYCFILFVPEKYGRADQMTGIEREVSAVKTYYRGGNTSVIVALFLKEQDAQKCLEAENLQFCDPRWHKETIETLRAVGKEHPYCSISTDPEFWLMPVSEWQSS